jgi:hypothetical protein
MHVCGFEEKYTSRVEFNTHPSPKQEASYLDMEGGKRGSNYT